MMNNTALLRQIQIDLIADTPNPIVKWFNDIWSFMFVVQVDIYHNTGAEYIYFTFINCEPTYIFYLSYDRDKFICNYDYYWKKLNDDHDLSFDNTQSITKLLVENALTNEVSIDIPVPIFAVNMEHDFITNGFSNHLSQILNRHE